MDKVLKQLASVTNLEAWLLFLAENSLLTCILLYTGHLLLRRQHQPEGQPYSRWQWLICGLTNLLNTVVTYTGFWLWKKGIIMISPVFSWRLVPDFLLLFFAMDLLMFLLHFVIHKTFLYKMIHRLHHEATDPRPIDLFILHPVETLCFGALWLALLAVYACNIYAIIFYLIVNIVFGLAGHLGIEPIPAHIRRQLPVQLLGTSSFHHRHHQDTDHNFGFYTSVWDRLFGTFRS